MFFVRGTGEGRKTTVCTPYAESAIAHRTRIVKLGLTPVVTDFAGRELTLKDLRRRLRPVTSRQVQ